jgi:vanillate O-demethylase ferredoxin subunit
MTEALRLARILARRDETPAIAAFDLVADDGAPLPPFEAGAHVDVELGNGLLRQYSLLALPDARHVYRIGVLRDPNSRGGSLAMHALKPGDALAVSAPRNHFALARGAADTLLFAGGIGVTPLLAMAQRLDADGAEFALHYCVRSPAHAAFRDRLAAYAGRVAIHCDDGPAAQRLDVEQALAARPRAQVYVCGPAGFMSAVLEAAARQGRDPETLHREYFGAAPAAAAGADGAFSVRLARSGRTVDVASGQSILQALLEAGLAVPKSCEAGVCGTCLTRVLEGAPDHRDFYLSKAEKAKGDQMLLCCSRAKSAELALDL